MKKQIKIVRYCKKQKVKNLLSQIHYLSKANSIPTSPVISENILMMQIDREIKLRFSVERITDILAEDVDNCIAFIKTIEYRYLGNILF